MATKEIATKADPLTNDLMSVIERIAANPDADVTKLEKMLDLQERILNKEAVMAFNQAMARLQPLLPVIEKTTKADKSFYAKYEHIDAKVRPLYTAEGFSVSYTTKREGDTVTYYGTLSHVAGHSVTAELDLPADKSGSKNDIQAKASTLSYAKRYLLQMLLNIVTMDEDNDGVNFAAKIDEGQLKQLQELCARKGITAKQVAEKYKVPSLSDMDQKQFLKAYNLLNARKDVANA